MIRAVRRATGLDIPIVEGPRRAGDPAILYANADKLRRELGWSPRYTEIDAIVATAWNWFQKHPHGYGEPSVPSPAGRGLG